MKNSTIACLCTAALALSAGCGDPSDDRFRRAIPNEDSVRVNAPDSTAQALTVAGQTSEYYKLTRKFSRDVNGGIAAFLSLIHQITLEPPTTRDGDKRVWGPGSDALDPAIYRLTVIEEGGDQFTYTLAARPKGSPDIDANYLALISGEADTSSGTRDGKGSITLHVDGWVERDPTACGTGSVKATYDTTAEPQSLSINFVDFLSCEDQQAGKAPWKSASYYFDRAQDGSGNFQFVFAGDVHDRAFAPVANETFAIRSRWNAIGQGRADVSISAGDLELRSGVAAVKASECWDEGFALVFASMDPEIIDASHVLGTADKCAPAFARPLYATDL